MDSPGAPEESSSSPEPSRPRFPSNLSYTDSELPKLVVTSPAPETRRGWRAALMVLLLLSFLVVAWIASRLWVGIALGAVMASTTQPLFRRLMAHVGRRRWLAAALVTIGSGLFLVAVVAVVFYVATDELISAVAYVRARIPPGSPSELIGDRHLAFLQRVGIRPDSIDARLQHQMDAATGYAATATAAVLHATTGAVFGIMITLVTMYYVLVDWARIALHLEGVLPLDPRHTRALILEFRDVGRGTLVGTLGTAMVQGALAGVSFFIGGAPHVAACGLLTSIASLLPVVGTGAVWAPIGVFQIASGHVAGGVFILVWGFCVVMTVTDYVIRPRLVGRGCHAHPLLVLIALLGGIETMGLPGLIVAPILVALFVAVLRIYERENTATMSSSPT